MRFPNWKPVRVSFRRPWRRLHLRFRPELLLSVFLSGLALTKHLPGIRHAFAWHVRRQMRKRPGHFEITRRKSLLRRLPWGVLTSPRNVAAGVAMLAVIAGSMMADAEPVGNNPEGIAQQVEDNRPAPPPMPGEKGMHLSGQMALMLQVAMLQDSLNRLEKIKGYTAKFEKQERIDGELSVRQVLAAKIRHKPFSVYFNYEFGSVGQEVLYPISGDDSRMLVKSARLGGRLPAMKLDPNSTLAMSESRYPVTMAGIKELTKMTLEIRQFDMKKREGAVNAELRDDVRFDSRPVYAYTVDYASAKDSPTYRRCVLYIDKQLMLPVYARNWTWSKNADGAESGTFDDSTLIEYYAYRKINAEADLKQIDFARNNSRYNFN